jgi:hypothetical protein
VIEVVKRLRGVSIRACEMKQTYHKLISVNHDIVEGHVAERSKVK